MADRYVTIRTLLDRVTRHPMLSDVTLEAAADYAADFLRITGCSGMFSERTAPLVVRDWRAPLPCDWVRTVQVRLAGGPAHPGPCLRYSTDSFHIDGRDDRSPHPHGDPTYKIQGGMLYCSLKDCTLEMAYLSLPVDGDGLPLLPDDAAFLRALELYIKVQRFTVLYDTGRITAQVMDRARQDYGVAVRVAESSLESVSPDEMESIAAAWTRLIGGYTGHRHGFRDEGRKETLRIQP